MCFYEQDYDFKYPKFALAGIGLAHCAIAHA